MLFETTQISLETGIWLQVPVPVQKVQVQLPTSTLTATSTESLYFKKN